jgi:hypothetical protein
MRIGKTPKKLDSVCCHQRRETKADTLKQLRPYAHMNKIKIKKKEEHFYI